MIRYPVLLPDAVIVDGNFVPDLNSLIFNGNNVNIMTDFVIKGDSKSLSIAAASIIAKVTRDRMMYNLSIKHPDYKWDT